MSKDLVFPAWEAHRWREAPENPLIEPVGGAAPRAVVGDPQVILPGEFDDQWHMFVWGCGKEPGCRNYLFESTDGIAWTFRAGHRWDCTPCGIFRRTSSPPSVATTSRQLNKSGPINIPTSTSIRFISRSIAAVNTNASTAR